MDNIFGIYKKEKGYALSSEHYQILEQIKNGLYSNKDILTDKKNIELFSQLVLLDLVTPHGLSDIRLTERGEEIRQEMKNFFEIEEIRLSLPQE